MQDDRPFDISDARKALHEELMAGDHLIGRTDPVERPAHYQGDGMEAIEALEDIFGMSFHLATAMKYILRHANKGNPAQDLRKAAWYVERVWMAELLPPPEPEGALASLEIANAFDLSLEVAAALDWIMAAATDGSDADRRNALGSAMDALGEAIAEAEAAEMDDADSGIADAPLSAIDADLGSVTARGVLRDAGDRS